MVLRRVSEQRCNVTSKGLGATLRPPASPNLTQNLFWSLSLLLAIFDWPVVCVVRCVKIRLRLIRLSPLVASRPLLAQCPLRGGERTYKIQASETLQGHTEPEAHEGGRLISRQCLSKQTDKDSRRQKDTKCTTKVWTNVNMRTIKQEAKTNVNENVIERQKPQ